MTVTAEQLKQEVEFQTPWQRYAAPMREELQERVRRLPAGWNLSLDERALLLSSRILSQDEVDVRVEVAGQSLSCLRDEIERSPEQPPLSYEIADFFCDVAAHALAQDGEQPLITLLPEQMADLLDQA